MGESYPNPFKNQLKRKTISVPTQRLIKRYVIVLDASARGSPGPQPFRAVGFTLLRVTSVPRPWARTTYQHRDASGKCCPTRISHKSRFRAFGSHNYQTA